MRANFQIGPLKSVEGGWIFCIPENCNLITHFVIYEGSSCNFLVGLCEFLVDAYHLATKKPPFLREVVSKMGVEKTSKSF